MENNLLRTMVTTVGIVLTATGCGNRKSDGVVRRSRQPDYVQNFDEKAMDKAIAEARATWNQFSEALSKPTTQMRGFSIKRGFRVKDDPAAEHIWLNNVSFDGKRFKGTVNDEPVDTKEVKMGDIVEVTTNQLSDWMYIENGVLRGGYTIRVLLQQESPKEREAFLKQVGFRIEEPNQAMHQLP